MNMDKVFQKIKYIIPLLNNYLLLKLFDSTNTEGIYITKRIYKPFDALSVCTNYSNKIKMTTISECSGDDILTVEDLKSMVRHSIRKIICKEELITYKVSVKDLSTNGGNYFGSLQTVTVNGKTKNGEEKELNIFLKTIIQASKNFPVFSVPKMYQREGFLYKEIFKYFKTVEDKYNIPHEDRLRTVKVFSETNSEVIILEDITKLGFKTNDRFEVMHMKFAELAIEQLAKLHAVSFVIQNEDPKYFENNIKSLHSLVQVNSHTQDHHKRTYNIAIETLEDEAKIKFDNYYPTIKEKFLKMYRNSSEGAICLVHGDYRPNNILVKDVDGVPSAVFPVDYQLASFDNPILDFIFFIFLGTDQKFRKQHLEHLKNVYYSNFESFLSKFGVEAAKVYSKEQFDEQFKDKVDLGLMYFLCFMPFIFARTDAVPELDNGLEYVVPYNLDECYKDRLYGIVDDLIQWGYM
ncbi:uncharacterized protein LOC135077227 [Ostrinia nubilalis]|uniref:uncharacterized protein LOC135077227 n=1 Tax=Ostrinia nubilalis TaxID=29057 RepID=UPI0030826832